MRSCAAGGTLWASGDCIAHKGLVVATSDSLFPASLAGVMALMRREESEALRPAEGRPTAVRAERSSTTRMHSISLTRSAMEIPPRGASGRA